MEHMHKNILIVVALLIAGGALVYCYRAHHNCSANVAVQSMDNNTEQMPKRYTIEDNMNDYKDNH